MNLTILVEPTRHVARLSSECDCDAIRISILIMMCYFEFILIKSTINMTFCPVCKKICIVGSLKTGVYRCQTGHKWFNCRKCKQLKINEGDSLGICGLCDGKSIDDRMLSYRQCPNTPSQAKLGTLKRPDTFLDSRHGGRFDDDKVADFVFYRPSTSADESRPLTQKVDSRPMPSGEFLARNNDEVFQPRATQCYYDPYRKNNTENPFVNRMIPQNTVYQP